MSLQICPNCKTKNITWSIDEEESPLTLWRCDSCGYEAYEDETKEIDCPACGTEKMNSLIKDATGFHRWCYRCNLFELAEESFEIEEKDELKLATNKTMKTYEVTSSQKNQIKYVPH